MSNLFAPGLTADSSIPAGTSVSADTGPLYVNLPTLANGDFANRLLRLFPRGWLSDAAQVQGGAAYGTFLGVGTTLAYVLSQLQFIANGIRVKLAYGTALDTISLDYFGPNGLPRNPGESDTSYRARIIQNLLIARVTRLAIQNALQITTGVLPRMGEPWTAGGDCAAYDVNSYYDVDGAENVAPGRYGDSLAFTGFINVSTPVSSVTGGYPLYGLDIGAAYDVGTSAYDLGSLAGDVSPTAGFESSVMARIQAFKAMGTTVGVQFISSAALANTISSSLLTTSGGATFGQGNEGLSFTLQSWLQAFGVWLEVLPWQASAYISQRGAFFTITASVAPSSAYSLGWLAAIYKYQSPLALRVPVKNGQSSFTGSLAIPAGQVPILMPDWDTIPYVTALGPASISVSVSSPGPGTLDIIFVNGSQSSVSTGATTLTVTQPFPSSYALFATPSWATTQSVAKTATSFTLTFGTAAPAGAVVYWSAQAN